MRARKKGGDVYWEKISSKRTGTADLRGGIQQ